TENYALPHKRKIQPRSNPTLRRGLRFIAETPECGSQILLLFFPPPENAIQAFGNGTYLSAALGPSTPPTTQMRKQERNANKAAATLRENIFEQLQPTKHELGNVEISNGDYSPVPNFVVCLFVFPFGKVIYTLRRQIR
ncbi:hypothetical protein JD844_026105, partial [Phrynosoma platyrhinos]